MDSLEAAGTFVDWLRSSGGHFHESLEFRQDETSGLSVYAKSPIEAKTRLISVPSRLSITIETAHKALEAIYKVDKREQWNERMLISSYLILHWLNPDSNPYSIPSRGVLGHREYVNVLPPFGSVLTPLLFNEQERDLLVGTNLHGAVSEQEQERREEFEQVKEVIQELEWEQYRDATIYLSSRAFPSRLLSSAGQEGKEEMDSYPVLIPGLDLFNHARATPITWLSSLIESPTGPEPSVSFVTEQDIQESSESYNNYGPKSNEELILSYGFVLDPNPDDTLSLKIGSNSALAAESKEAGLDMEERFVLRKDGIVPQNLLKVMRAMIGGHLPTNTHQHDGSCNHDESDEEDEHLAHEREMEELQLELDVLGTLGGMLQDKLDKMQVSLEIGSRVRKEVKRMIEVYKQGQVDILEKTLDTLSGRIERLEGMMDQGMGGCPCGC